MSSVMTVSEAFARATDLQLMQSADLGVLQQYGKDVAKQAVKQTSKTAVLKGTQKVGARTVVPARVPVGMTPKSPSWKPDLKKVFLWGPAKAAMKKQGGFWKWTAYAWDVGDAVKNSSKAGFAPVVVVLEFGLVVTDIVTNEHLLSKKEELKSLASEIDWVASSYTGVQNDLQSRLMKLMVESREAISKGMRTWCVTRGRNPSQDERSFDRKLFDAVMNAELSGTAAQGRTNVRSLVQKGISSQIGYLINLAAALHCLGVAADGFADQCELVASQPDNITAGFPDYIGFKHPSRQEIISMLAGDVRIAAQDARKMIEDLDYAALMIWSAVGAAVGVNQPVEWK